MDQEFWPESPPNHAETTITTTATICWAFPGARHWAEVYHKDKRGGAGVGLVQILLLALTSCVCAVGH